MEEQKAPLILIVQRIRLNFRNELVKLTTKGRTERTADATTVKILRAAYVNEKFSHRTFLISPLAWKTMPRSTRFGTKECKNWMYEGDKKPSKIMQL